MFDTINKYADFYFNFMIGEYPDNYVARIFDGKTGRPTNLAILRKTLEECREDIKASGYSACFPRSRYDDPIIVESWV